MAQPSPHVVGLIAGCFSRIKGFIPSCMRFKAVISPAGPAPTMITFTLCAPEQAVLILRQVMEKGFEY